MVELADFASALDAGSVARTAYDRVSNSRKREHMLAIQSAKAETRARRIEKAAAMLWDQEPGRGREQRRGGPMNGVTRDSGTQYGDRTAGSGNYLEGRLATGAARCGNGP
ncbi:MAG TPA: YdeI/OmpD-associated family protein [Streptosporangiaceae bacterium]|nr:YdeI/OmpD-associated family protein [Streptosporangiaceae bacterium]